MIGQIFQRLSQAAVRFLIWLLTHSLYKVRVAGGENIPQQGGALIVANHISWVDGVLMLTSTRRMVRFLIYADYANQPLLNWLANLMGVIPVKATAGPKAIVQALQAARQAIQNGEVVCIFAEGQISRTGRLQPFQRGLLKIVQGTDAPVIPAYLHGLWGSIFSYWGGRVFWKRPRKWPYPVRIVFGKPIPEPDDVNRVRQAVELLGVEAAEMDKNRELIPVRKFIRQSKQSRSRAKIADSSGVELTGGKLLAGSLAMKRVLERLVLSPDEKTVGVLLPPSVGGAIANLALALSKRVSANLNYTMPDDVINFCVRQAGIRHVLTSRRFLEKKPIAISGAELVFLEDLKERITGKDKLAAALGAYVTPAGLLERSLGLTSIDPDELLSIIFTSGSTGEPKGVMLSHSNIGTNVDGVDQMLHFGDKDVLMGVLPFFHSFGYTGTLWLALCYGPKVVYHFNPLDARIIGNLCEKHGVTIVLATPTFLKTYLKRIEKEQFRHLDLVVVGAEKMPLDLAEAFRAKFGIWPTEGYGTTELSPVVAANVPDHRSSDPARKGTKPGAVGRPLPGVSAKVVDAESGADVGLNQEGLLKIKGPNVMQGYLNQPEKTAAVMRDGWYDTGDFAKIDEDGFITITGRQSRFSKIGGEMVPHIRVEEEITRIVESPDEDEPEIKVAVTSIPDAGKGERLIVLHKAISIPVDQIRRELSSRGLPNLWIPGTDSFVLVEQIPLLGTGKLDLRGMKELALATFAAEPSAAS